MTSTWRVSAWSRAAVTQPDATRVWVVVKPSVLLTPRTSYEVQVKLAERFDACGCEEREWTTFMTFSTGDSEDHVAPEFAGVPSLAYGKRLTGEFCGFVDYVPVFPGAGYQDPQDDDWNIRYNTYIDDRLVKSFVHLPGRPTGGSEVQVDCGGGTTVGATPLLPGSRVEFRAVDLAGNESAANAPLDVPDVCNAPATSGTETVASRGNPGCSLGRGTSHGVGIGATLLVLATGLGRRRRVPRNAGPHHAHRARREA